jgi:hypothetical protein|mmetsp:Transcript_41711/g.90946  ORF Transcript_41711/g.90946 Transcript_41711/m.90946 type:complete len:377 (-) Transcript_41711:47-1177(-)
MIGWNLPLFHTCVCDADDDDMRKHLEGNRPQLAGLTYETAMEIRVPQLAAPKVRGFFTYSSAPDQPLLGVPIREGGLWHLSAQDRFEPVNFSLYVNGFSFSTADGLEASVSLSPFSLVRNCRFQSGECSKLKSFKVSLLEPDPCCYFAVRSGCEREAEEERSDWVLGLSHTILLITDSLLPSFSITCDPVPGVPQTYRRLMAGYLIHRDDGTSISVLFCELQAHNGQGAKLILYENDLCDSPIMDIPITESSVCCDVVGINCSCFIVDCHHFAAQTPSERKLWLRALSNVKVKIQNQAPDPDEEDLEHYRISIREHIAALEATMEPRIVNDALLTRCARKSLQPVGAGDNDMPTAPNAQDFMAKDPGQKACTGVSL